jgi:hypothetical protein
VLVDLPCKRIECDEIWSFCYAKQKNVPREHRDEFGYGDVWTWTAICAQNFIYDLDYLGIHRSKDCVFIQLTLPRDLDSVVKDLLPLLYRHREKAVGAGSGGRMVPMGRTACTSVRRTLRIAASRAAQSTAYFEAGDPSTPTKMPG